VGTSSGALRRKALSGCGTLHRGTSCLLQKAKPFVKVDALFRPLHHHILREFSKLSRSIPPREGRSCHPRLSPARQRLIYKAPKPPSGSRSACPALHETPSANSRRKGHCSIYCSIYCMLCCPAKSDSSAVMAYLFIPATLPTAVQVSSPT
jgi:hypothetical protein